jgi:hypothetical protein
MKMLELSPELQKKLDELLSSIERNKMTPAEAAAKAGDLKDLLAQLGKLDPEALKKLEAAAANTGVDSKQKLDAQTLADRAKRDANAPSLPADLKKAFRRLPISSTRRRRQNAARRTERPSGRALAGHAPQHGGERRRSAPSIQMSREASRRGSRRR